MSLDFVWLGDNQKKRWRFLKIVFDTAICSWFSSLVFKIPWFYKNVFKNLKWLNKKHFINCFCSFFLNKQNVKAVNFRHQKAKLVRACSSMESKEDFQSITVRCCWSIYLEKSENLWYITLRVLIFAGIYFREQKKIVFREY